MKQDNRTKLDMAVRVYPVHEEAELRLSAPKRWRCPEAMLVFDTETRVDSTQRLTFGSYRFFVKGQCTEEGLFYADDLSESDRSLIDSYVAAHKADTAGPHGAKLQFLTRSEFVHKFFEYAYRSRCLVVGFNLPFDLSRIAREFTTARGRFAGGFSLGLWSYRDKEGQERSNTFRPRIAIKHIDSKRALKGFTSRFKPDTDDLIPEDSENGEPRNKYKFRGHFLDLRTLAFALTDQSHTLETACEAFEVAHGKQKTAVHGVVTEEYIDYNRRDVLATTELAEKLLAEYSKHPITLQPTKAYSPASIGKAYLRTMGIRPLLERQPDFPKQFLGHAQTAFFGGRTSAHIRKVSAPVVFVDFLSMYPTVNALMNLWKFVIADNISVVEHCQDEINHFLATVTPESLFNPDTWKRLTAFVKIIPDGNILPTRAKYSESSNDWQVALNYVHADPNDPNHELWFSLPDVIASILITGKSPKIIDAFRIEARGLQSTLAATKLSGCIDVDPAQNDFFKRVIEERKSLRARKHLSEVERNRLDKSLKVRANSASYGIYAEMNRQEADAQVKVTCHGLDEEPFTCHVMHPDVPGEYCFPPLASLITGAARLMLALLERTVSDLGGTYAMEDTDSMAIVATKGGGLFKCSGGTLRTKAGKAAVRALSWRQVDEISKKFMALNPYDRNAVPGSILKIEDENFDPNTSKQRQLYCYAISAKRYTLFLLGKDGDPMLLEKGKNNKTDKWSQHGLGHLLNPIDPDSDDRDWIGQVWLNIIRRALGLKTTKLKFENLPAVGRISVTSPAIMRTFASFNEGKDYAECIKPFNFGLTVHVKQLGHPTGTDPEHFHLISPYSTDSRTWLKSLWIDQYSGDAFRIAAEGHHGSQNTARVKTYGEVLREYEFHPESKCADAEGVPCEKQTVGLLSRRHVTIDRVRFIGKESNSLEEVAAGMVHSDGDVYTEYCDIERDEWQLKWLPQLREAPLDMLINETGMSRRALIDLRAGRSRPHARNLRIIIEALCKIAGI